MDFSDELLLKIFRAYVGLDRTERDHHNAWQDVVQDRRSRESWEDLRERLRDPISICPPWMLAQVCQHWRDIVIGEREFWHHVNIDTTLLDGGPAHERGLLEQLSRCRDAPLFVRIDLYDWTGDLAILAAPPFQRLLEMSDQWHHLRMDVTQAVFKFFPPLHFRNLVALDVTLKNSQSSGAKATTPPLGSLPALRSLLCSSADADWLDIPTQGLLRYENFECYDLPWFGRVLLADYPTALQSIAIFSHVTHLSIHASRNNPFEYRKPCLSSPIVSLSITHLQITPTLFSAIRTPNLQTLDFADDGDRFINRYEDDLDRFFAECIDLPALRLIIVRHAGMLPQRVMQLTLHPSINEVHLNPVYWRLAPPFKTHRPELVVELCAFTRESCREAVNERENVLNPYINIR